jgi:hypothetical protein
MEITILRKKIKRAEFKRKIPKFLKMLVFGFIVLWSFLMFYHLYGDISWKKHIDQFRKLLFLIHMNLTGIYKI